MMYSPTAAGLAAQLTQPLPPLTLPPPPPPLTFGYDALGNAGLGNISDDLIKLFSLIPLGPGQNVASKFAEFKQLIRTEAEAGAMNAVPQIKIAVKQQVTPYVIAALGLGIFGAVTGVLALRAARKRS